MVDEIFGIVLSGVSTIILGLAGWALNKLIAWLDVKTEDKRLMNFIKKATDIVSNAVKCVYQDSVQKLKEEGGFTPEAQEYAKQRAIEMVEGQLTADMREYISNNFGDIKEWVSQKIESVLYDLKNKNQVVINQVSGGESDDA